MPWFFSKYFKTNLSKSLSVAFKLSHFLSIKYVSCNVALCAVHGTLHHAWHFAALWLSQEVAPNAKYLKVETPFAKIHFLIYKKINAFSCLCQWTITQHMPIFIITHTTTHCIKTWVEPHESIYVHIKNRLFKQVKHIHIVYCDSFWSLVYLSLDIIM